MNLRLKRELAIAAVLLAFGLVVLPYAIYFVGVQIIGDYESEDGALGLGLTIWSALAGGEWAAWVLVLSPYAVVQLLRLAVRVARFRPRVTAVTD